MLSFNPQYLCAKATPGVGVHFSAALGEGWGELQCWLKKGFQEGIEWGKHHIMVCEVEEMEAWCS